MARLLVLASVLVAAVLATRGRVYAVADGMGGHQAGQIAAELALKTVFRSYYGDAGAADGARPDVGGALARAAEEANRYLLDVARTIPDRVGMGTTLTAVVVREDELIVVQVGDSRCYLLRGGRMQQPCSSRWQFERAGVHRAG